MSKPSPNSTLATNLRQSWQSELESILNWWNEKMIDCENGGFYGQIDGNNLLHPKSDKGIILNTRILWTFSAAYKDQKQAIYKQTAERAYQYLLQYFWDDLEGGLYWMVNYKGDSVNTRKQIYAQAFGIYALTEYYQISGDQTSLDKAIELYWLIEKYSRDMEYGGYFEAFGRSWEAIDDLRLSDKDANEAKTMNTHLHVLEAYTNLAKVDSSISVKKSLKNLIQIFLTHFIHPETHHLNLFFDEEWNLKSREISFGHDIETAWLLVEAAEVLGDKELLEKTKKIAVKIADITIAEGIDTDGGLWNEGHNGKISDTDKHWWPQAEAMVGFYNAFQLSGDFKYLQTVEKNWDFIQKAIIDKEAGEWFFQVTEDHQPYRNWNKAGPWKAPYHNVRALLEMLRRTS